MTELRRAGGNADVWTKPDGPTRENPTRRALLRREKWDRRQINTLIEQLPLDAETLIREARRWVMPRALLAPSRQAKVAAHVWEHSDD